MQTSLKNCLVESSKCPSLKVLGPRHRPPSRRFRYQRPSTPRQLSWPRTAAHPQLQQLWSEFKGTHDPDVTAAETWCQLTSLWWEADLTRTALLDQDEAAQEACLRLQQILQPLVTHGKDMIREAWATVPSCLHTETRPTTSSTTRPGFLRCVAQNPRIQLTLN